MSRQCDCLNRCGDDPRMRKGLVQPCAHWFHWNQRARIVGVTRDASNPLALTVIYTAPPADDDLRALHDFDRWPNP